MLIWLCRPIYLLNVHFSRFDMLTPRLPCWLLLSVSQSFSTRGQWNYSSHHAIEPSEPLHRSRVVTHTPFETSLCIWYGICGFPHGISIDTHLAFDSLPFASDSKHSTQAWTSKVKSHLFVLTILYNRLHYHPG